MGLAEGLAFTDGVASTPFSDVGVSPEKALRKKPRTGRGSWSLACLFVEECLSLF
jgi:hypothetical protein